MLTNQQILNRKTHIGGSDVAAIMGLSEFKNKTAYSVYAQKVMGEKFAINESASRWGNKLESIILDAWEEDSGIKLERPTVSFFNDQYPWLVANVDGVGQKIRVVVDAKTSSSYDKFGGPSCEVMPKDYLLQLAHYCLVLDAEHGELAVLFKGNDFKTLTYKRNDNLEKLIIDKTKQFYEQHMVNKIAPEPSNFNDCLMAYSKTTEGKSMVATNQVLEKIAELKSLKEKLSNLKKDEEDLKCEIMFYMRDAVELVDVAGKKLATWKSRKVKSFDSKALKNHMPDVYDAHLSEKESRVFLTK